MAQLPSIYRHRQIVGIHGSRSPPTRYLHHEQMCRELQPPDPATYDEWLNFTKGQGSSRIPYPTLALDTDAWCQFPCGGRLGTPLTRLRLFFFPSTELQSRQPWTVNPQFPETHLEIIRSRRSRALSSVHLHPPFTTPQTPSKVTHLWKGARCTRRGSHYVSSCRS